MDYQEEIQEIINQLDQLADPERVERAKTNYPTSMIVKGVTVPNLRPIAKELTIRFRQSPPDEIIHFAKLLNTTRILEAQQIAFDFLEHNKAARTMLTLDDLLELGEGMDNWVSVDHFAGYLAGPAWREGQISDDIVEEWAVSEDRWWRRAAVVCTVALNQKARGGTGDPERTLKICELIVDDTDDMVSKAQSWALRELAKRDPEPVAGYISKFEAVLPKRVIREVRRKLTTGRK